MTIYQVIYFLARNQFLWLHYFVGVMFSMFVCLAPVVVVIVVDVVFVLCLLSFCYRHHTVVLATLNFCFVIDKLWRDNVTFSSRCNGVECCAAGELWSHWDPVHTNPNSFETTYLFAGFMWNGALNNSGERFQKHAVSMINGFIARLKRGAYSRGAFIWALNDKGVALNI